MVFVDLSMDSAEVARCDSAYDSLMRIKK